MKAYCLVAITLAHLVKELGHSIDQSLPRYVRHLESTKTGRHNVEYTQFIRLRVSPPQLKSCSSRQRALAHCG